MGYMISNTNLIQSGYTKFLAPAKLNLFLKVLNKRSDGYHNLQSVFQLIDLYDEIYIKIRNDNKINFMKIIFAARLNTFFIQESKSFSRSRK